MTQDESFQFHTVVYGYFKESTLIDTSVYEQLYGSAIEDFDIALKQVRESEKTVNVTTLDRRRDVLYRGAVKTNAAAMHHFNPEIASASHAVDIVFRNYGDPTKLAYPAETSVIYNLCQELQMPAYAPLLVKLGLTEWIEELKLENEAFDKMYNDRATEQSILMAGLARNKRHSVEILYRNLISIANVNLMLDSKNSPLLAFVDIINEHIALYKKIIAARTTRNNNRKKKNDQDSNKPI
jgi:hypothetical protein